MMVSYAKQVGSFVQVFDENNRQLFSKAGELVGFTSTTVSIKVSGYVQVFNEHGSQTTSYYVG